MNINYIFTATYLLRAIVDRKFVYIEFKLKYCFLFGLVYVSVNNKTIKSFLRTKNNHYRLSISVKQQEVINENLKISFFNPLSAKKSP